MKNRFSELSLFFNTANRQASSHMPQSETIEETEMYK